MSTPSIMFQGELSTVNRDCPVVVADSECSTGVQALVNFILLRVLPPAAGIATVLILILIILRIKMKKSSKR